MGCVSVFSFSHPIVLNEKKELSTEKEQLNCDVFQQHKRKNTFYQIRFLHSNFRFKLKIYVYFFSIYMYSLHARCCCCLLLASVAIVSSSIKQSDVFQPRTIYQPPASSLQPPVDKKQL